MTDALESVCRMRILSIVDADKLCLLFNFPLLGILTAFSSIDLGKQLRYASFLLHQSDKHQRRGHMINSLSLNVPLAWPIPSGRIRLIRWLPFIRSWYPPYFVVLLEFLHHMSMLLKLPESHEKGGNGSENALAIGVHSRSTWIRR